MLFLIVGTLLSVAGMRINPVAAQTEGIISGSVTNVTLGVPGSDLEVSLSRFTAEGFQEEIPSNTDAEGNYQFDNLDTDPANVYATSVEYKNVLYASGMLRFNGESTAIEAEILVYETTTSSEDLHIQSKGFVLSAVDTENGETGLLDVSLLRLDGDLTIVPNDNGHTVEFPVPLNAREVTPLEGFNFGNTSIEGATVFASAPFIPGSQTATLAYTIPYTGTSVRLELDTAYQTEAVNILILDTLELGSITVEGIGVVDEGRSQIGDQQYRVWSAPPMAEGSILNLAFRNLPESQVTANTLSKLEPIVLSVFVLIVAVGITLFIVYKRGLYRPRPTMLTPVLASTVEERRNRLIEELRTIEKAHEEDRIDEEEYWQYRTIILEQLRQISRQMRDIGDTST